MLIVQKFGGSSISCGLDKVADRVLAELELGNSVAVVVSAFAGETDYLLRFAEDSVGDQLSYTSKDIGAELDVILSCGEQKSAALVAIVLNKLGVKARSFLGWQCCIETNNNFGHAEVSSLYGECLQKFIDDGGVPIIAGFQGVDSDSWRITTLGRGGTDYTAVAVAVSLGAARCDIYTDVDGVYSADPNVHCNASFVKQISFAEMLEMSLFGSKVLQHKSVALAARNRLPLRVLSLLASDRYTYVTDTTKVEQKNFALHSITGLSVKKCMNKVVVTPSISIAECLHLLAKHQITSEMLSINEATVSLVVSADCLDSIKFLKNDDCNSLNIVLESGFDCVSLVGTGLKSDALTLSRIFWLLHKNCWPVYMMSSSDLSVNILVDESQTSAIVSELLGEFGLLDVDSLV